MATKIAESNKGVPAFLIRERVLDRAVRENAVRWLPTGAATYAELMKDCDRSVRTELAGSKIYGTDPAGWVWGKSWQSRFPHPLANVPFIGGRFKIANIPINGSGQTPNVGSAVSMRHIASPGNWDETRHVIPLGQSGDPASPHFRDQFDAWATGSPMIFPFTKAAVEKAAKNVSVLTPKQN
jgi:penicillin amidase